MIFFFWIVFSFFVGNNSLITNEPFSNDLYKVKTSKVVFVSQAPLEKISGTNTEMKGIIDGQTCKFAFSVPVASFQGFNSALQKTHFNENYLETKIFPSATFEGKFVDVKALDKDGDYPVKGLGKFTLHGISQEKMIAGVIKKKGKNLSISANFNVTIADYSISIPKVVEMKIAKTPQVTVTAELVHE